jgi:N-acetylglucosaminyldiphosphoundecaprenol N-acetyl-beta-D-mannosaminyltransferase
LIKAIITSATKGEKKLVLYTNTYGVTTYLKNKQYADVVNSADIIYPDGWGPVLVSRLLKERLGTRATAGDFIDELLENIQNKRLSIYLLGSRAKLIKKTVGVIKRKYPKIKISGYQHGYFTKNSESKIVDEIIKTRPNIVLVGMGIPKQEFWMNDNWKLLPNAIYMGVGGVFEYIAGKKRAPLWMRNMSLEWFYRLCQEPKRLWKRYTLDNIFFIFMFLKSLVKRWLKNSQRFFHVFF